jgi:hypothetical protein
MSCAHNTYLVLIILTLQPSLDRRRALRKRFARERIR